MKELLNKKIYSLYLDKDQQYYLSFYTDAGQINYVATAECCSETWFADIIGVDALLHNKVVSVEDIDVDLKEYNIEDGRSRQEYDTVYGHRLKTEMGVCDIIYRNSSNGYYGGSLELVRNVPDSVSMMKVVSDYPL